MDRLSGNKVKYGETFEDSFNLVCDYLQPTLRSFECLQICENIYATVLKECLYNNYILCLNLTDTDTTLHEFLFNCIYKSLFFKNRACYDQYCKLCIDSKLKNNLREFIASLKTFVVTTIGTPSASGKLTFEKLYIPSGKVHLTYGNDTTI